MVYKILSLNRLSFLFTFSADLHYSADFVCNLSFRLSLLASYFEEVEFIINLSFSADLLQLNVLSFSSSNPQFSNNLEKGASWSKLMLILVKAGQKKKKGGFIKYRDGALMALGDSVCPLM